MKNKVRILLISVVSLILIIGCNSSAVEKTTIEEVPEFEVATYTINGNVKDAKTGVSLEGVTITTNTSDDATLEHNASTDGLGAIVITSTKKDVNINVVATKDGYVDTGLQVLTTGETTQEFVINMVNIDNEPTGVQTEEENITTDVEGKTATAISFESTIDSSEKKETTSVNIPAGTSMTTSEGEIVTGALKMQVTSYSASEQNSTDSFPGGFAVIADTNGTEGNATTNITFETAGFVSIQIKDEDGNKVKSFDPPIEVKMQLDENFTNPLTGNTIAIGDTVPVWSYDDETAEWKFEQNGTVEDLNTSDGLVDVVVTAAHLSYWNLDWHYSATCNTLTLNLIDTITKELAEGTYQLRANFTGSSGYLYQGGIYGDGFADLRRVPLNREMTFTATVDGAVVGTTTVTLTNANCTGGESSIINMDVTAPAFVNQTMTITESCADGITGFASRSGLGVYTFIGTRNLGHQVTDASGKISGSFSEGATPTYHIRTGNVVDRWKNPTSGRYARYGYFEKNTQNLDDFTHNFELLDKYCIPVTGGEGAN